MLQKLTGAEPIQNWIPTITRLFSPTCNLPDPTVKQRDVAWS